MPRAPAEGASALNRPGLSIFLYYLIIIFVHFSRGFRRGTRERVPKFIIPFNGDACGSSQDRVHRPSVTLMPRGTSGSEVWSV